MPAQPHQRSLTETEAMVVDCLKQLTQGVFRPHFRSIDEPLKQNVSNSPVKVSITVSPSKNRASNGSKYVDDAMAEAEKFCAMVAHQLIKLEDGDAHNRQLDVYHSVHKSLFDDGKQ